MKRNEPKGRRARPRPRPGTPGRQRTNKLMAALSGGDAHEILQKLCREDKAVAGRVADMSKEILSGVDVDDVADSLFDDLEMLKVEDVWDHSGGTRHGYVDPSEYAYQMVEEVLESYREEMRKCMKLGLAVEARKHCLGIMKGLFKYSAEGANEFRDWAVDAPSDFFDDVYGEWKVSCRDPVSRRAMTALVRKEVPEWVDRSGPTHKQSEE